MTNKYLLLATGNLAVFMMAASPAWAVQAHGGTEGLITHQIGHFLFAFGMGYLLFRLYTMRLEETGWFEFRTFIWLLILWNVMTFSGHWMNEFVASDKFVKADGHIVSFTIESLHDVLFYLTRLDHLILVPSFAFLLLALRKWRMAK